MDQMNIFAIVTLLVFVVWLGIGMALARKDAEHVTSLRRLEQEKVAGLVDELKLIWSDLPEALPLDEKRKELARCLVHVLPSLCRVSGVEPGFVRRGGDSVSLIIDRHHLAISPGWHHHVSQLVHGIGDPVLERLWRENDIRSLITMLRVLLMQPIMHKTYDPDEPVNWPGEMMYVLAKRNP